MNINKLTKIELIELVKLLQTAKSKTDSELLLVKHKLEGARELLRRLKRNK